MKKVTLATIDRKIDSLSIKMDVFEEQLRQTNESVVAIVKHFDTRMDRLEQRIDGIEVRMDGLDKKIGGLPTRAEFNALALKLDMRARG
jgi:predicted  nucleic acid-binding Zn-ribbon protein